MVIGVCAVVAVASIGVAMIINTVNDGDYMMLPVGIFVIACAFTTVGFPTIAIPLAVNLAMKGNLRKLQRETRLDEAEREGKKNKEKSNRCPYCQSAIDAGTHKCPNCGSNV